MAAVLQQIFNAVLLLMTPLLPWLLHMAPSLFRTGSTIQGWQPRKLAVSPANPGHSLEGCFMVPVPYFGPSNQVISIKEVLTLAKHAGCTVVSFGINNHYSEYHKQTNAVVSMPFDELFDRSSISEHLVPVITFEEARAAGWDGSLDMLLLFGPEETFNLQYEKLVNRERLKLGGVPGISELNGRWVGEYVTIGPGGLRNMRFNVTDASEGGQRMLVDVPIWRSKGGFRCSKDHMRSLKKAMKGKRFILVGVYQSIVKQFEHMNQWPPLDVSHSACAKTYLEVTKYMQRSEDIMRIAEQFIETRLLAEGGGEGEGASKGGASAAATAGAAAATAAASAGALASTPCDGEAHGDETPAVKDSTEGARRHRSALAVAGSSASGCSSSGSSSGDASGHTPGALVDASSAGTASALLYNAISGDSHDDDHDHDHGDDAGGVGGVNDEVVLHSTNSSSSSVDSTAGSHASGHASRAAGSIRAAHPARFAARALLRSRKGRAGKGKPSERIVRLEEEESERDHELDNHSVHSREHDDDNHKNDDDHGLEDGEVLGLEATRESIGKAPFLAIHVRPYPDECQDVWRAATYDARKAQKNCRNPKLYDVMVPEVKKHLKANGLKGNRVFVMSHPAIRHHITSQFRGAGLVPVYMTTQELPQWLVERIPGGAHAVVSLLSFVEQEVCQRARVLIAASKSSMSRNVVNARYAYGVPGERTVVMTADVKKANDITP